MAYSVWTLYSMGRSLLFWCLNVNTKREEAENDPQLEPWSPGPKLVSYRLCKRKNRITVYKIYMYCMYTSTIVHCKCILLH